MGGMTTRLGTSIPPTVTGEKRTFTALALAAAPNGASARLLLTCARQSGLGNDATDPLPLRLRDTAQRGTHVGLLDPAQYGQRLLHPVVPVEERLVVGDLHHRVDPVCYPASLLQVAAVYSVKHLHVQIGDDAAVPGENAVGADAQGR